MNRTKELLINMVVSLSLAINESKKPHFVEVFLDYHLLEVVYYGAGFNGDEMDVLKVRLREDVFAADIDKAIDYLKEKV